MKVIASSLRKGNVLEIDGKLCEGYWRSHQVPMGEMDKPSHIAILEQWMRSYRPEELFGEAGMAAEVAGMTIGLELRYAAPTPVNAPLVLEAHVVAAGERIVEMAGRARHHPLWTLTAAMVLVALGVTMLAAGLRVVGLALVASGVVLALLGSAS